jgi:hypothetical protein
MLTVCPSIRRAAVATGLVVAAGGACAQSATEADLARRVDALAAELASVKAELATLRRERAAAAPTAPATASASGAPTATSSSATAATSPGATATASAQPATGGTAAVATAAAAPSPSAPTGGSGLVGPSIEFSSYGEINYNRPTNHSENAQADLRRFVLGIQHRVDPKTKVVGEIEIEHAVSSSSDPGEVEIEQAYAEREFTPTWAGRAGLFLIPAGLLNENHEPTAYYGVERNFVETAIIPSTWREGGLQVIGTFENGITAQGGITTSFDLTKWDATSSEGRESPLGSIHQELALAKAKDLAVFGAVNWRGVPGLLLGGSLFTGNATHSQANATGRVTLWDLHARWTPGRWDLAALYSRGTISNTAALNATLVGNPTLIPSSFDGWYVQGAYRVWSNDDYSLTPFVRYEQFNTARSFADLGPGLTPSAAPTEKVLTFGANFLLSQQLVFKADIQRFSENKDMNRFNLGFGWSF